jgi:hypothetical protein
MLLGCHGSSGSADTKQSLIGTWERNMVSKKIDNGATDKKMLDSTITFNPDGTFTAEEHNFIMVVMEFKRSGTYTVSGDKVTLKGRETGHMGDGYKDEKVDQDYTMTLQKDGDGWRQLGLEKAGLDVTLIYRKIGASPLKQAAQSELPGSEENAAKLRDQVVEKYASLKSYQDTGEYSSEGTGYMVKKSNFRTKYLSSGKILFIVDLSVDEISNYIDAIWGDTKLPMFFQGMTGGKGAREPLGNALGIIGVDTGIAATTIPELLLPQLMKGGVLRTSQSLKLLPDSSVGNIQCSVLQASMPRERTMVFWIDKSTLMILQATDSVRSEKVIYHPKANPTLKPSDFEFTPPKSD